MKVALQELAAGDEVWYVSTRRDKVLAKVVKVGRVWLYVDITSNGNGRSIAFDRVTGKSKGNWTTDSIQTDATLAQAELESELHAIIQQAKLGDITNPWFPRTGWTLANKQALVEFLHSIGKV